MNFYSLNSLNNYGKIYLAITDTKNNLKCIKNASRKVFVRYDGINKFTYFSLNGSNISVIYPNDFHNKNETIAFYEINLPEEIVKNIQSYGTQY
jgi:hypothetical protein